MWPLAALLAAAVAATANATPCEEARMRCAYRTGCGAALNNYMVLCNEVLAEPTTECPKECEHALIALTSTVEGKELMNCRCEDGYCVEAKQRIEVCRPQVLQGAANATSSCRLSQLICLADAECATALQFYDELCRSMYRRGRKCSHKCLNSIEILRKQEKAAALTACRCDGNEDYDCPRMQNNLQRLCFHKKIHNKGHDRDRGHNRDHGKGHDRNNERGNTEKHPKKPQEVPAGAPGLALVSWLIIMPALNYLMYKT